MFALVLLLLGAPWWAGVGAFLVVYNAGHFALRVWSLHLGLTEGLRVAERLRRIPIGDLQQALASAGAFLVGLVLPLAVSGALVGSQLAARWIAIAVLAAAVGVRFGARIRAGVVAVLIGVVVAGILFEVIQ